MEKRYCYLCSKGVDHKEFSLHRIPKNPCVRPAWVQFCKLNEAVDDISGIRICSAHFTDVDYINPNAREHGGYAVLKPNSLPSILKPKGIPLSVTLKHKLTTECEANEAGPSTSHSVPSTSKNISVNSSTTKRKYNTNCCVYGCHSRKGKNKELHFHQFPQKDSGIRVKIINALGRAEELDKRMAWERVLLMGKPVTKNMRVCSKHFREEDYCAIGVQLKQPKLRRFAIPSQNHQKKSLDSYSIKPATNVHQEWLQKRQERIKKNKVNIGKPAALVDVNNPDWVPSRNMGYQSQAERKSDLKQKERLDKRSKHQEENIDEQKLDNLNVEEETIGTSTQITLTGKPAKMSERTRPDIKDSSTRPTLEGNRTQIVSSKNNTTEIELPANMVRDNRGRIWLTNEDGKIEKEKDGVMLIIDPREMTVTARVIRSNC